jgi:hypothetical protein
LTFIKSHGKIKENGGDRLRLHLVIGAGGTGSYFVSKLCSHLSNASDNLVILLDGDVVESKNLERQGFTGSDLGKNKAIAILDNIHSNYPKLTLGAFPNYVVSIRHLLNLVSLLTSLFSVTEIIFYGCSDNNAVRARLLYSLPLLRKNLGIRVGYIDSGNNEYNGQVLSTLYDDNKTFTDSLIARYDIPFEEALTYGDFELSCADVTVSSPQNILTNQMAASLILKCLEGLEKNEPINYEFDSKECMIVPLQRVNKALYREKLVEMQKCDWFNKEKQEDSFIQIKWY